MTVELLWKIGFITLVTDRTITLWLIIVRTPSFLFPLMPSISLCSLSPPLYLSTSLMWFRPKTHPINTEISRKVMFALTDPCSLCLLLFSFFSFFSPPADPMIYSEWERTVFILPLLINGSAGMTWKTKCYEKNRAIPLFTGLFLAN